MSSWPVTQMSTFRFYVNIHIQLYILYESLDFHLYTYFILQVHLKKFEYREKVLFFVTYFKKWNFHIF